MRTTEMTDTANFDVKTCSFSDLSPLTYQNACITIGNFDGVHLGHQAIIKRMVQEAQTQGRPVLVITFFPDPADFFQQGALANYLSSPREKEDFLLSLGVDKVITFEFDRDFASLSPEVFLRALKDNCGLATLVVGHDFALGKDRVGTIPVIETIGEAVSFSVKVIPPVEMDEKEISSTRIRQLLDKGDVAESAKLLGRPYAIAGVVTHGSDRGARIGLPTANLEQWPKKKMPAVGVYATLVELNGQMYQGITNIGYRPTFEQQDKPNMETHILGFDGNIYGERLVLNFIEKIRDEQKFAGVEEFLAQIERDKDTARRIFTHVTS
jgi:riboflavin kinase/FMN adenylyltransferase